MLSKVHLNLLASYLDSSSGSLDYHSGQQLSFAPAVKMYYHVLLFKKAFTPLINIAKDSLVTNQLARAR